jgi:8-oxo-dGTP diphosphatase
MKKIFQIRVCGILFIDNKLLLVKHRKNNKEYWVFPGGRVEFAEKAEKAIIRELKEELNLKVKVIKFLFYNESLPPEYPVHSTNLFFLLEPLNKKITLMKDNVLVDYNLFKKEDIKKIKFYPKISKKVLLENFYSWIKEAE